LSGARVAAGGPPPAASEQAGARAPGRRRRRGATLDGVLSAVLTLLVTGSLYLTGRLWLNNPYLTPPPQPPPPYVAPGAEGNLGPADLLVPMRLVLHEGSAGARALDDPSDPLFKAIWAAALPALRSLDPQAAAAAPASDAGALAAASATAPSLELRFGVRLPWQDWWDVLAPGPGRGTAGAGPPVDRVLVVPGASATTLYLAAGASVRRATVPAPTGSSLDDELRALRGTAGGIPLRPFQPQTGAVRVLPGQLVPLAGYAPPLLPAGVERPNAAALVAASFRDPSVVRRVVEADGSSFFTDGEDWLRISPDGAVRWSSPRGAAAGPQGGLPKALGRTAAFVDGRGGWPGSAFLAGVVTAAGPAGSLAVPEGGPPRAGYLLRFATRVNGWPVFGSPDPLVLQVGAQGIAGYVRRVPTPLAQAAGPTGMGPEEALNRLAAAWPAALPQARRVVSDVWPCYVYLGAGRLTPAWAFGLAGGGRAMVDALDGHVIVPAPVSPA
jgi:hypothetical protein